MDPFALLLPVVLIAAGGALGRVAERRHERSLRKREALLGGFVVTDLRRLPGGPAAVLGTLVLGEVVIASDYGKQFVARLRNLIGGEVRSYQRLMDRARREALLRAIEQARARGATAIVNARFETTIITTNAAEVLCYGTAVKF